MSTRRAAGKWGWALLLLWWVCLARNKATGSALLTELKVCVGERYNTYVNLVCPSDHLVIIAHATYRRSRQTGCHPSSSSSCVASDLSGQLTMPCFFRLGTCKIKLVASAPPTCSGSEGGGASYGGDPYFHVLYKCEPIMLSNNPRSQTADMCGRAQVRGTLIYLWNTNFPQYTLERTCRCMVTIAQYARLDVKLPHFKAHRQDPTNSCPQVIHFWSGGEVHSVCSEADDSFEPLEISVNSSLYIEFDNPLKRLTQFWISLSVHQKDSMIVECGSELVFPPRPLAKVPQRKRTTTLPPSNSRRYYPSTPWWDRNSTRNDARPTAWKEGFTEQTLGSSHRLPSVGYIPVVAGVVGAVLVIVIIIMVAIFGFKKKRKRNVPTQATAREVGDYAFDNEIYMTDGTRAQAPSNAHARAVPLPKLDISNRRKSCGGGGGGGGGADTAANAKVPKSPNGAPGNTDKGKFLALEAPKSTVVQNPYAGLPAESPQHTAPSTDSPSKRSISSGDYEDLREFQQVLKTIIKHKQAVVIKEAISDLQNV